LDIECEEKFKQLKYLLTNAPVLKIADPNKDLFVCTDACKEGLEGVLMQEGHVTCYESRKLNEHEINYMTHDLELATIVHALKMWRHYLLLTASPTQVVNSMCHEEMHHQM
jgi:hypothetical protein